MAVLRSSMAPDRPRRLRFAATCIALFSCLLTSCHSFGQPYSGTKWLVNRANQPWCCYDAAPNKISAFVGGVGYTTGVTAVAIASTIGETLILPLDLVAKPEDALPPRPLCEAFWGNLRSYRLPTRTHFTRRGRPSKRRRPRSRLLRPATGPTRCWQGVGHAISRTSGVRW